MLFECHFVRLDTGNLIQLDSHNQRLDSLDIDKLNPCPLSFAGFLRAGRRNRDKVVWVGMQVISFSGKEASTLKIVLD